MSAALFVLIVAVGYATYWPLGLAFHVLAVADAYVTRK